MGTLPLILPAAWHGCVQDFLDRYSEDVLGALRQRHVASAEQLHVWVDTLEALTSSLRHHAAARPSCLDWWMCFEYELPREGGRRPDVLLVADTAVLVVEVKAGHALPPGAIDQCRGYVRDLKEYHACCRHGKVHGVVLVTRMPAGRSASADVTVCNAAEFESCLHLLPAQGPSSQDVQRWLEAPYAPLPTLIEAAQAIFRHQALEQFPRAQSAGIPKTLETLESIIQRARTSRGYHLVLLSGSPGAGKTLVGLQAVHNHAEAIEHGSRAVFLSGNGPLVEVLQYALQSKVFVQDVHRFMYEYGVKNPRPVEEDVLVFDEAQRAWDQAKVTTWYQEKKNVHHPHSEPETFIRIGSRRPQGMTLIGLIGYGQEIHNGEEGGVAQWGEAVAASPVPWTIHCAPRLRAFFPHATVEEHSSLDLSISLRAHASGQLHVWVENMLEGRLTEAASVAKGLHQTGFYLYQTDNLDKARTFLRSRYHEEPTKNYGLLASSKSKNLPAHGINTAFKSPDVLAPGRVGPWFFGRNGTVPECRGLRKIATEFQCQGLELDGALVAWGSDLTWDGHQWRLGNLRQPAARDPLQLRKNSYRVLLTRARDGLVIFCPTDAAMGKTTAALEAAGVQPLP